MHRVLLVNHDEELLMLLKLEISELRRDLSVDIACYLPAALQLVRVHHPEIVVLGIDGWPEGPRKIYNTFVQALRPDARFVLVGQAALLQQYRDLPAAAYLPRPINLASFRQALAKAEQHGLTREEVRPPSNRRAPVENE